MELRDAETLPCGWGREGCLSQGLIIMVFFYLSGEKKKRVGNVGAKRRRFLTTGSDASSLGLCFPIFNGNEPSAPLPLSTTVGIKEKEITARGIALCSGSQTLV